MNNRIRSLLIMTLLVIIFQQAHAQTIHKYLFVSPEGSDYATGTVDQPLASFEGAQKLVREFKPNHVNVPVTVYFRGGKYYRSRSVIFNGTDGGTKLGPVKYMAYPGETPLILGGKQLKLKWTPYQDGIFKAKVLNGMIFESLFIDNEEQVIARYPNYNSNIRIFNGTAEDCMSEEKVKQWANPADGYFHVIHKSMWGAFHFRITGKEDNGKLAMEGGWQNNRPENGLHPKLRYVENIFEELDTEKEWYLDRNKSILYFKPAKNVDLSSANVEVAYLDNFIKVVGTEEAPVKYLTFDGFHFSRTIRTFMQCKDRLLRSDWAIYRHGAVFFEGTEHCGIENCIFNQIGGNAIFVNAYNRYAEIKGCHIFDIGANAICFVGDTSAVRNPKFTPYGAPVADDELDLTPGPKNNNYPAYCFAENNLMHDFGKVEKQVAGVQISMAAFITVGHNSIYDCPRAGINISEGAWGGHLIEFNDVFNTVLETSDHGSFNSWGRDRFWMAGNGGTEKRVEANRSTIFLDFLAPTIIRNNRMRCDHGWDIDLDDGSSYYHLYNNLCLKNGIKLREGYYRKVENNICINNAMHPHVWLKNNSDIIRGNIFGSRFFPIRIDYWGTEIDYNWYMSEADLQEVQKLGIDRNSKAGDPMFVDPANGDFTVCPESEVFHIGWNNFPMDQFGVQKEELKKIAKQPEIPAIITISKTKQGTYDFYGGQIKSIETNGEVSATGMHNKIGVLVVEVPIFGEIVDFKLEKGDVILKINGELVQDANYFLKNKSLFEKEENVKTITAWRNQKELILK
jgi:hypothetical protein